MSLVVPFEEIFNDEGLLSKASHWKRFELKSACTILNGFALKSKLFNSEQGFPIIRIRDLKFNKVQTYYTGEFPQQYVVDDGDLLIGMDGDFICYEWGGGKAILNQRVCKIVPNESILLKRFLFYGINGYLDAIHKATSSVTVGHLSSIDLGNIPFPIPPIDEQKAIVAKLDAIMQKVDANKQRMEKIPKLLKRFREAVLAAAVNGKLTEEWREENSRNETVENLILQIQSAINKEIKLKKRNSFEQLPEISEEEINNEIPESWKWVRLGAISQLINGDRGANYPNVNEYVPNGIPWINTGHIEPNGTLSNDRMNFITRNKFNSLNSGKTIQNDLVYCLRGATLGKTAIVQYNEGAIASSLVIVRKATCISAKYIYYYLTGPLGKDMISRFDNGTAQPNLSANNVKLYIFPLAPENEQIEIVSRVDQLFDHADNIEARYLKAKAMLDKLPQSILAKAFRGELVPQDPDDEPPSALLERIRTENAEGRKGNKQQIKR